MQERAMELRGRAYNGAGSLWKVFCIFIVANKDELSIMPHESSQQAFQLECGERASVRKLAPIALEFNDPLRSLNPGFASQIQRSGVPRIICLLFAVHNGESTKP